MPHAGVPDPAMRRACRQLSVPVIAQCRRAGVAGWPGRRKIAVWNWMTATRATHVEDGGASVSIIPQRKTRCLACPSTPTRKATSFRSEEHKSELQSLMRISYAVFCLKKKQYNITKHTSTLVHTYITANPQS